MYVINVHCSLVFEHACNSLWSHWLQDFSKVVNSMNKTSGEIECSFVCFSWCQGQWTSITYLKSTNISPQNCNWIKNRKPKSKNLIRLLNLPTLWNNYHQAESIFKITVNILCISSTYFGSCCFFSHAISNSIISHSGCHTEEGS